MLSIAIQAARVAGNIIVRHCDRLDRLHISKKGPRDFVSEVDEQAEMAILQILQRSFPRHSFLAEESGQQRGSNEYRWIIDPLDGTTNYLHGLPHYAVSIALQRQEKLQLAVIYDPIRQELFTALRGQGAYLNDRRIRVSHCAALENALIGTGFPFRPGQKYDGYCRTLGRVMEQTAGIRRAGSAALDLAYVAAGRFDGFWEYGLKSWDVAAGILLIEEAGGLVHALSENEDNGLCGDLMASNSEIFQPLKEIIESP